MNGSATIIIDFTKHRDARATAFKKPLYLTAGEQRELLGYILEKSGVNNGYYFVSLAEYAHVEERFQRVYHAIYVAKTLESGDDDQFMGHPL